MGWYNAGSDDLIVAPNVFGTLQLPHPSQCFGVSESGYGAKERDLLLRHILDQYTQARPWPEAVTKTFSKIPKNATNNRTTFMGSPFLDILLSVGQVVEKKLTPYLDPQYRHHKRPSKKEPEKGSMQQFDKMLPPESDSQWVMCYACLQWRRVAWYVDATSLSECWTCNMNHWDRSFAACNIPEDYDPTVDDCLEPESFKELRVEDYLYSLPVTTFLDTPVGTMKDVYCVRNKQWFKGKILKHMKATQSQPDSVRVHFQGWRDKFDETVELDSGRIQPLNNFSNEKKAPPLGDKSKGKKSADAKISVKISKKRKTPATTSVKSAPKRAKVILADKPNGAAVVLSVPQVEITA
jgi:hypothetical protein